MSVDTSNATIAAGVDGLRARIAGAIKQAANSTGASFQYLLAAAKMESDFNPSAGASTSSAHGLYQFIEQTWLGSVKEAGPQLGFGRYADAITKTSSGDYTVSDPAMRQSIMKLRDDPAVSAAMAGVLTQSNSFQLTGQIGRRPTDGELYMAHFLGAGSAARLINGAVDNPQASAARMFPAAAAANRSIFYDRSGQARTVSEVYSVLNSRYLGAASSPATQTALAMYGASPAGAATPATPAMDNAAYLSSFPNVASAATAAGSGGGSRPATSAFHSLFQVDGSQPISAKVQELWGSSSLAKVASADGAAASGNGGDNGSGEPSNGGTPQPLDLFSDRDGTFSS
jgi:hypothetical protein